MIVLEGTPGAGKTTRLGALLTEYPDTLIFPEAQPSPAAHHRADVDMLLAEDHQRTGYGAAAAIHFPDVIIASDRCHLGVLAYRYALVSTGRAGRGVFEQALERARCLELDARHHLDEVHVTIIDPELSCRRRALFAGDPRYRLWFDVDFLDAYNRFMLDLDRWVAPGPRWTTSTPSTRRRDDPAPDPIVTLRCARGCNARRSAVVRVSRIATQLYAHALHHRSDEHAPVTCLRTAREVTSAWATRANRSRRGGRGCRTGLETQREPDN